ncbi:MAG: hypothetical protein ACHQTE_00430 [Candidatus Saccharimonadales bacterium]
MSNPDNQDEPKPIESETVPYSAPDGKDHILDLDAEAPNVIKKPLSE